MRVLLIIDMLKDFINEDGALYCGETAKEIVPFIKKKIDEYRISGCKLIYICDSHDENDKEFSMFKPHCIRGTEGADIIDELKPKADDIILKKRRYSGFYDTDLGKVLKEINPDTVEIVGVCTSVCVMDTVGGLRNRDYRVRVYKEGVADFDKDAHKFSLKRMKEIYGAEVV
jgi:nicotinamidase-related amidase